MDHGWTLVSSRVTLSAMNYFVTSDSHFSHANIIKYCNRPFASPEEMDEALVERWNKIVKPSDHVLHLGDVAMKKPGLAHVKRLHGHKRLAMGNHDIFTVQDYLKAGFEKIVAYRVFDKDSPYGRILFSHVPVHPESMGRFKAQVHGHIHDHPGYGFPYINVSVERTDYAPVALDDIVKQIDQHMEAAHE
jgi:calcineurin-like phosphoesterase family protein